MVFPSSLFRLASGWLSPQVHWRRFQLAIWLLFVFRGVTLLTVLPPFEGWDEYQHLAYIDHLAAHGEKPVLGEARVSIQLLEKVLGWPQPVSALPQFANFGGASYSEYWEGGEAPAFRAGAKGPKLYQAQQSPLYYQLAQGIFGWAGGSGGIVSALHLLRVANLALGAGAMALLLWLLGGLVREKLQAGLLVLVVSLQPLWLLNFCRVSNDALAVLLGVAAAAWVLCRLGKARLPEEVGAGVLLGVACLAKATNLALIPFTLLAAFPPRASGRWPIRKLLPRAALVVAIAALCLLPAMAANWERYGEPIPIQESVSNREAGHGLTTILFQGVSWFWPASLADIVFARSLWSGGWSFLEPPSGFTYLHAALLSLGLLSWWIPAVSSKLVAPIVPGRFVVSAGLLVVCVATGLLWHLLQSKLRWGEPTTNPWYAAVALPFLLMLAFAGAARAGRTAGLLYGWLLVALYACTEMFGTFYTMVPHYSGGVFKMAGLERVAQLHPWWLGTETLLAAAAGSGLLLALVGAGWLTALMDPRD